MQAHQTAITAEQLQALGQEHIIVAQEQALSDQVYSLLDAHCVQVVLFAHAIKPLIIHSCVYQSGGRCVHPADNHHRWTDSSAPDDRRQPGDRGKRYFVGVTTYMYFTIV